MENLSNSIKEVFKLYDEGKIEIAKEKYEEQKGILARYDINIEEIETKPKKIIYNNYEYEIFDILKSKPGLRRISKRIERELPRLFIEF